MNFTLAADADYLVLSTPFLFVCRFILLIYLTLYGDDHTHIHKWPFCTRRSLLIPLTNEWYMVPVML